MRYILALVALSLLTSCGTLPAGYVGVKTRFGAVTNETVQPGLYFFNPFIEGVEQMDCQTHAYKTEAAAASHDLQNVSTTITLNFKLLPEHAVDVYSSMRRDYGERIIVPSTQEAVKSVTARYEAVELITKRELVRSEIEDALRGRLLKHGIAIDQISITNFAFSADFANAIEAKVVATQNALRAENELKTIQFQAQQAVATARGQAEAIRIQAEAIHNQGGMEYVQLKAIEKWQGGVPQYVMGTNAIPFINLTPKQ